MIIASSLLAGLISAASLLTVPAVGEHESAATGTVLLGFAVGWALMAVLSGRIGDGSQRWAAVPAIGMGITGAVLLVLTPSPATVATLGWFWPPALLALTAWMVRQARRGSSRWATRVLLYPVFAVLLLTAVGGYYETLHTSGDSALADGHGLIDVGGHRLAIRCVGSGNPTVVLEPGLGESSRSMGRWIAPAVARTTRICTYDRAGHGRSDPAPAQRSDAARDLHLLLRRAGVRGPVVVAGHSLGGIFALNFTERYPDEVAGVVLLDSMHPKQTTAFEHADPLVALVPTLSRTGIASLFFDQKDGDPARQMQQFARDVEAMPAELDRAARLRSLGRRPLVVVTAGQGNAPGWPADQTRLAALSSRSSHRTIATATHQSLIDDRAQARYAGDAIRDVVDAVRGS